MQRVLRLAAFDAARGRIQGDVGNGQVSLRIGADVGERLKCMAVTEADSCELLVPGPFISLTRGIEWITKLNINININIFNLDLDETGAVL